MAPALGLLPRLVLVLATCDFCTSAHAKARFPNALKRMHTSVPNALTPGQSAPYVPLLLLIFTQRKNKKQRAWQRATFLGQRWRRGELRPSTQSNTTAREKHSVSWKYVYLLGQDPESVAASTDLDRVNGDCVTLSSVRESYANLVFKTLEALRWALRHVSFGCVLKTDDDSIVHVGRVAMWLHILGQQPLSSSATTAAAASALDTSGQTRYSRVSWLYAGRIFNDSQVIRSNFSKSDLQHPAWFPDDFVKWAVPYDAFCCGDFFPPYCSGGGYLLGREAASRVVHAYDARVRARRPVVHVEDAFVGILAHESGLTPTDLTDLIQDPPVGRKVGPSVFTGKLLVHRVTEPTSAFTWLTFPVKTSFERAEQQRRREVSRRRSKDAHTTDARANLHRQ